MTAPVFVDTNVLLHALDEADKAKQTAAQHWRAALWQGRRGRVGFQVLAEFYANALRLKLIARDQAGAEARDLLAWNPVVVNAAVVELGWRFQDRYQLSFCDSLILAAAKLSSCSYLLTEDFQAGQILDGIEVVNPLLKSPANRVGFPGCPMSRRFCETWEQQQSDACCKIVKLRIALTLVHSWATASCT